MKMPDADAILLKINDLQGRTVFSEMLTLPAGVSNFKMNVGNLPAGIFTVSVGGAVEMFVKK